MHKILWIFALSLLEALQALMVLAFALSFFPTKPAIEFLQPLADVYRPERDAFLFELFVVMAAAFYVGFWRAFKTVTPRLISWVSVEAFWAFAQALLVLKMAVHTGVLWPKYMVAAAVLLSLLSKVYWPEFAKAWGKAEIWAGKASWWRRADILAVIAIALIIFVPDLDAVVARLWLTGDAQHSNNTFTYGAVFAYMSGLLPCVDVRSYYGVGLPSVLGAINKSFFGQFDYVKLTGMIMGLIIIHYAAWYLLMRQWLKSFGLAVAGILLTVHLTVFGGDGGPLLFFLGFNTTAIRFLFDVIFFACLYGHLRTRQPLMLLAAAAACGLQLFYVLPSGICLTAVFYAYALMIIVVPACREHLFPAIGGWRMMALAAAVVPAVYVGLTTMVIGHHFWTAAYWHNLMELPVGTKNGFALFPYFAVLKADPWMFSVAIVVLAVYLFSLAFSLTSLYTSRKFDSSLVLMALLAVYGLMDYHQFVMISAGNVLFRNAKIFVILGCLWVERGIARFEHPLRLRITTMIAAVTMAFLVTNPLFIAYPNVFNFSRNPNIDPQVTGFAPGKGVINRDSLNYPEQFKLARNSLGEVDEHLVTEADFKSDADLKAYIKEEFSFAKDAALIRSLTPEGSRVAVVSSHELPLLLQAGRKPYFYVFPLIAPRPMRMRTFPVDEFNFKEALVRTVEQMERDRPPVIFVQKILLQKEIPQAYFYQYAGIVNLMRYIHGTYAPYKEGQYLMALKRL